MSPFRPFLLLVGRAATFWLGAVLLICVSIVILAVGNPEEPPYRWVDSTLTAAIAFPAAWGFLAGLLIQELQHTSFAWPLPGIRRKLLAGFLASGLAVIIATTGRLLLDGPDPSAGVLLAAGIAGLCLGGVAIDPISGWGGLLTWAILLGAISRSRRLAAMAAEHRAAAILICLAIAGLALLRLFGTRTFRAKPFRPTAALPGMYSFDRLTRYERRKALGRPRSSTSWRRGYLGQRIWPWVTASFHEAFGYLGLRGLLKVLGGTWPLWILLAAHAWSEMGDLGFARAFATTLYQEILDPPGLAHLGEDSHEVIVTLFVAAAGAAFAFWSPAMLRSGLVYPLSRRSLFRVAFRSELLHSALFLVVVGGSLLVVGEAAGWLAGYPPRLDFVPFVLRPLAATVILMPAAEWAAIRTRTRSSRESENGFVIFILGLIGFVIAVGLLTFQAPRILPWPALQPVIAGILLAASQILFRSRLERHFTTADLV